MNYRLISKHLGLVALMLAFSMMASLPWAFPWLSGGHHIEGRAIGSLLITMAIATTMSFLLLKAGRRADGQLFRRESLALVGLSWCLATMIGALPFMLSRTCKAPSDEFHAGRGIPMTIVDALFESASGFSGTGATVITDLDSPDLVPRAILFWRSETHFLGGLGIMVLFVALLDSGSSGKVILLAETPASISKLIHARVQHTAWAFIGVYLGLNVLLTLLLIMEKMSLYDALCHSFGTIATGGFSTHNASVGYFQNITIEITITLFMALSCVNFALLYQAVMLQPDKLFRDVEIRIYFIILFASTIAVILFGLSSSDFSSFPEALRYSLFQVTSILTNTGFVTHDFDQWNQFSRGLLLLLMFIGGCAGSTSCSIKVIRHMIFWKVLKREFEKVYHPNIVRPIRIGGDTFDEEVGNQVLFYFGLVLSICVLSWIGLILFEPDAVWTDGGHTIQEKMIDCASCVGATINCVGPGMGTIGATKNYAHLQPVSKILLTMLMLFGRLEMIPVLVLFMPRFWRRR